MHVRECASGALFGIGLFASGVYMPAVIKAQFSFTSNVMITTMMGASAASALIFDLLHRLNYISKAPGTPSNLGFFNFDGNVLGGVLIGVGMASTGACPGTSFVQAGAGSLTGMLVVLGGVLGALTFVKLQDALERARTAVAEDPETKAASPRLGHGTEPRTEKSSDIAAALGIPPVVLLLVWVPMCLAVMRLAFAQDQASNSKSYPGLIPPTYGGLVIGLAQLATVLLTGHAIGASGGYEDVARWLESKFSQTPSPNTTKQQLLTGSVTFSLGIFCAAAVLRFLFTTSGPSLQSLATLDARHAAHAMLGGGAMVIGARIARGCTSGHGISGLSKFSLPSLVTTASMFGAGIVTAAISR